MSLREGFSRCHLTYAEVHMEQFALGGNLGRERLEAAVVGLLPVTDLEYDLIALTLNEHLTEQGDDAQVGYRTM